MDSRHYPMYPTKSEVSAQIQKIYQVDKKISSSLTKAENLKDKASQNHSAGWSWGGKDKRLAIEALQDVTKDMAQSQLDIIQTQQVLFEGQKALSNIMRTLYFVAAQGMTANRMVHREIKAQLTGASSSQLSEIAREELRYTLQQLDQMQDVFAVQEKQKEKIKELSRDVDRLKSLEEEVRKMKSHLSVKNVNLSKSKHGYKSNNDSNFASYGTTNNLKVGKNDDETGSLGMWITIFVCLMLLVIGFCIWVRLF